MFRDLYDRPEDHLPRARYNNGGIGYWTVRGMRAGWLIQGVGQTLDEAYNSWSALNGGKTG